jgi:hypothetical protein
MPSSGSYFYPGVNKPNSSYPQLDVRGKGEAPPTAAGLGRIYVLSASGDLYYKDPDGNEIVIASVDGGAGANVFENIIVSGTATVRGRVTNNAGHLILSSSAGSFVTVSGTLAITTSSSLAISVPSGARFKANLGASLGGFLIGHQSTNGRVAVLNEAETAILYLDAATNTIAGQTSHLILSSTVGSVIKMSGAIGAHRATTATLPAGAEIMTGTILWDDTRKTMKIYGPQGWTPILTGTAG